MTRMKNSQKFLPLDGVGLLSSRSDALHRNAYLAALRHIGRGASGSAFPRGAWERVKAKSET
jgi:hypothetical protein